MSGPGAAFAEVVGPDHVWDGDRVAAFAVDGRPPRWAVFPSSAEEVGRCLAVASADGLAVAPTGRGTRLDWGNPPRALDVALSLRRLDRILAHESADLTLSVEAGVTLGAVAGHVAAHRQFLALDPARAAGSTIGGLVATSASGPYRARYGTVRDLLLGVTVALADGRLVAGGGRVVKNATGYDMPKLHVGALGTLGVVVSAHLRLHARPASEGSWLFGFPGAEAALEAGLGIMDAPVVVSRLQLLDGPTLARLQPSAPLAALAVTVGSVPEGVRAQGVRIAEICGRAGGEPAAMADPVAWWTAVADSTWPDAADCLTLRIGTRPTDVVKALRAVEAAGGDRVEHRASAEAANGVLHVTLTGAGLAEAGGLVARIRAGLAPLGGTCVVEHAPPGAKPTLDVWGAVDLPALEVMRRLKRELDASAILNPGRYVGGI